MMTLEWINSRFPPFVRDRFGGGNAMQAFPLLPWDDHFLGGTQYIDGVRFRDLEGHTARIGEDAYGRPFVVFAMHRRRRAENDDDPVVRTHVLFQRYTKSAFTWAFACTGPFGGALDEDKGDAVAALFARRFDDDDDADDDGDYENWTELVRKQGWRLYADNN